MSYAIDRPAVKLLIRVVGVLLTVLAILGAIDSFGLLLGGIEKNNPWPVCFGFGSFCADLGIAGAWLRISRAYELLSNRKVRLIRRLLVCGVVGAILLAVGTFGMFPLEIGFFAVVFIALAGVGIVFIKQTPSDHAHYA